MRTRAFFAMVLLPAAMACGMARAQQPAPAAGTAELRLRLDPPQRAKSRPVPAVVWLEPLPGTPALPFAPHGTYTLLQKNRMFLPHLQVVPVGSVVAFPNADPFFHNVFSLFDGKRFDLGLYEAGSSKSVTFSREGVSYIFCNIHPEMSAIIVVLGSPYFATTAAEGNFSIASVPAGRYTLHLWNENAQPATLQSLSREVAISVTGRSLGTLRVPVARSVVAGHKNKYGQDYEPPSPNNPVYVQP